MNKKPVFYLRRSSPDCDLSAQLDCLTGAATRKGLKVLATQKDLDHMQKNQLSAYKDIVIENSGD